MNVREKRSYRVFDDKKELLKEISLIRILAEEVIIKNSEIIVIIVLELFFSWESYSK